MKKLSYLLSLLFLMTLTVFTSCKDDEGDNPPAPTAQETKAKQLAGTWTVTNVTRPGVTGNVIEDGQTVTLTFTEDGTYSATNTDVMPGETPAFPSGTTWAWPNTTSTNSIVITPGNVNFNALNVTDNSLTFTYTTQDAKSQGADVNVTVTATK